MIRKKLLKLLPLLALLLRMGCPSPPRPGGVDQDGREQAARAWQAFLADSARAGQKAAPFSATLSVRYKTPEEGERFGAYFWSNLEPENAPPQPFRLDILGAMNATAATAYEDENIFMLYEVENNLVHRAKGSAESLSRLGVPLPLRLSDLAGLLNGRYAAFFLGQDYLAAELPPLSELASLAENSDRENVFALQNGRGGVLVLDNSGRPLRWREKAENESEGWVFEFSYPAGAQAGQLNLPGPLRFLASHPEGYSVSVLIKSLNTPARAFTPEQLRLNTPETATIKPY